MSGVMAVLPTTSSPPPSTLVLFFSMLLCLSDLNMMEGMYLNYTLHPFYFISTLHCIKLDLPKKQCRLVNMCKR